MGSTLIDKIIHEDTGGEKASPLPSLPENLMEILDAGGLVKAMQKRNGILKED